MTTVAESGGALQAELDRVSAEAAALRAGLDAGGRKATEAELATVSASGALVDRFLSDVAEAIKQVCVAGLAFPDPELPDELATLAERARRHRLPTAMEHLLKLRAWVSAVSGEKSNEGRQRHAMGAWGETQRLVAWLRLYRVEHDLLTVQGRLAAESTGGAKLPEQPVPTMSLTAWPVGVELDAAGKLLVFCVDMDSGRTVILRDHLSDFDRESPLHAPAVSRLFQDSVQLSRVLRGVVRLEDHPVVERPDALLFRPAFRAIPRRLPVAVDFKPPPLPEVPLDERGEPAPGARPWISRLSVDATRAGGRVLLKTTGGGELGIALSPEMRFNLTKLLLKGEGRARFDLAVLPRGDELLPLHVVTDLDERVHPGYDLTLFALPAASLVKRAQAVAARDDVPAVLGAFLQTAACLQGGATPEEVDALRDAWRSLPLMGIEAHYRMALASLLLGVPVDPARVTPIAEAALTLASLSDDAEVDLALLGRVLGRRAQDVSPTDMRLIDGAVIYRAVWLALLAGAAESLAAPLTAVFVARYKGELKSPTAADVCARALLLAFTKGEALGEGEAGDEGGAPGGRAAKFLQAHLDDLSGAKGGAKRKRAMPMPDFIELVQLGDTRALLAGADRLGPTVAALGVPREKLRQTCADALYDAFAGGTADRAALTAAGDALLVLSAAGLRPYFVV